MADATVAVTPAGSTLLDATSLTVAAQTVLRERHNIAGRAATELMDVRGVAPLSTDFGAVVRHLVAPVPVHVNATLTASGSTVLATNAFGDQQLVLMVNVVNAPTGTTPTIVFSVQEIDPGNGTTPTSGFRESQIISAAGVYQVSLFSTTSNQVKVIWTVTGTTPSFTGVYATLVSKSTPATASVQGEIRVVQQGTQLFNDAWDTGAMDTTDRWTIASAGGGVAAVDAGNVMTLGSGTTANGWSTLESKPTFRPASPGWNRVTWAIHIESAVGTNAYRFFGLGTNPGTPTAALPLTDAVGFEIDINGKCNVVTFASGTRNLIQDLSSATGNSKQVTDAASHQYIIDVRGDRIFWFIDTLDNCVAEIPTGVLGPDVNVLPLKALSIANSTPPGASRVITCDSVYLGDMTKSTSAISDGVFGFRRATVKAASVAAVATDTSLVVAISPNSATVTDGTNAAAVKAASTAAVAADKALVVAISPNSRTVNVADFTGTSVNLITQVNTAFGGGTSGPVVLGSVLTAAPTYSTGNANALSLTTAGDLRAVAKISDGTNTAAVKAASTAAVAADPALVVTVSPNTMRRSGSATYEACSDSAPVSSGTSGSASISLGYLFHPSSVTALIYRLQRLVVTWSGGVGGGDALLKLAAITAENGTPGGTLWTPGTHNLGNSASNAIFRTGATGAPTRNGAMDAASINLGASGCAVFAPPDNADGQDYEMRKSTAEGWEVRLVVNTAPTTAANFSISASWREEAQ